GISIVLAVDISSSMLAEDFSPANRLDVARRTATEFVRARSSDRIGLVAFAGQALTQVPITTDYEVLEEAIRQLRVGILEDGTAIGTAIATGAASLSNIFGEINRLEKTPVQHLVYHRYEEAYRVPLGLGLLALALELVLAGTFAVRVP